MSTHLRTKYLFIATVVFVFFVVPAARAQATTCDFGTYNSTYNICLGAITTTGASTWTVPADWDSANNTIDVFGGGGGGGGGGNGGGGGGAYSEISNESLTPGASVDVQVGAGGTGGTGDVSNGNPGGDTYFCNSTSNCASISGSAVIVGAKGGSGGGPSGAGGAGGAAASGVGTTVYSGGGGRSASPEFSGGGGGGAGGPNGNGAAGGAGGDSGTGGGGGGGADGGSSGVAGGTNSGGTGGNGPAGDGGGASSGAAGTDGGGGAGGSSTIDGGAGGSYADSGGGGGGGAAVNGGTNFNGGDGGTYGGGGGGGGFYSTIGIGGTGGDGIIEISYQPLATVPIVNTDAASSITTSSATANGSITSVGSGDATVRGVAWSTDSALSSGVSTTTESGSFGTGDFTASLSGLSVNTTYYYRAYATNSTGTGYGSIVSFTTLKINTPARTMRLFAGHTVHIRGGVIHIY